MSKAKGSNRPIVCRRSWRRLRISWVASKKSWLRWLNIQQNFRTNSKKSRNSLIRNRLTRPRLLKRYNHSRISSSNRQSNANKKITKLINWLNIWRNRRSHLKTCKSKSIKLVDSYREISISSNRYNTSIENNYLNLNFVIRTIWEGQAIRPPS